MTIKVKIGLFVCGVLVSQVAFAQRVSDLLQTHGQDMFIKPATFQNNFASFDPKSCNAKAYMIYALDGAVSEDEKEKAWTEGRANLREVGSTARSIGYYLGLMIGMRTLEHQRPEALTYYKASACAIRKAGQMGVDDPRMIWEAMGVVGHSYRLKKQYQAFMDDNVETGAIDLSKLQKEQKRFGEQTEKYVRMTRLIADMRCDITDQEADQIHLEYVMEHLLGGISGDAVTQLNQLGEQCAEHVMSSIDIGWKKRAKTSK